jgi:YfiH family protein
MHLLCPDLAALPNIRHGFFTRQGGVSVGLYASLNCGPGSGDAPEKVFANRAIVAGTLGAAPGALVTAHQIHSNRAVIVEKPWTHKDAPQADALVTNRPGIALGVLTADCLPILLADNERKIIAAAHAGWKGAFDGIIEATVEAMRKLGANSESITAAIGPGIAQHSYEVGPEFFGRFMQRDMLNRDCFLPALRQDHHLFDLKAYAKKRLQSAGVFQVTVLENDTCAEEEKFFSWRRTCLRKEKSYGRQISAIMIKNSPNT